MKLGVSSYSFRAYIMQQHCGYTELCDIAKRIGFDGIEFIGLDWKHGIEIEDELAEARRIRAYCAEIGLDIAAYTVGADLLASEPEAELQRLKHCVDVAAALGAPVMRHDICHRLRPLPRYTWWEAVEEIVPIIRELTRYAADKGVKTCSENHGDIFQDAQRVEALIRKVDDPNYGWLVDMGNFICADGDIPLSVRTAAPYAIHVHAKDFLWKSGLEPRPVGWDESACGNWWRGTVVGHGVIPVRQCVDILRNAGYQGYVSLEFEGWEENIPALEAGYQYLRSLI